jgi:hypothetical protein
MPSESEAITTWCSLVKARTHLIGRSVSASTGEEFTTSGDIALDNRVAGILLNTREKHLPSYGWVNEDDSVFVSRPPASLVSRKVQLLPVLLFTIDWAMTAPGVSWPETYYVTHIPSSNVRIITASRDDNELWGYSDLAIGLCAAVRSPDFGAKKILQSWWRRACGVEPSLWEVFLEAGLVDQRRARKWGLEVFGQPGL